MSTTVEAPQTLMPSLQPETAELERQPESVIKLLLDRVERGYQRGIDDDGHKIGLAFDPGGLAGVVSVAMARKLSFTGVLEAVDGFYGLSAGGLNALYAAAGQLEQGIDIYATLLPDNGLVRPASIFPPKLPVMDLDVLRDAMYTSRPLDVKKIVDEKIPVVLGATDLTQPLKRAVIFRSTDVDPEHPEMLIEQALAGSHIMVVAGKPVTLEDGRSYTDATMSWSSSIDLALADGCTDVLSLANSPQPKDELDSRKAKVAGFIAGQVGDKYLDKHSPELPNPNPTYGMKKWTLHPLNTTLTWFFELALDGRSEWDIKRYKEALRRKAEVEKQFSKDLFIVKGEGRFSKDINVERLYPPDIPNLPELLTMDKKKLRVGIRAGRLATRKALQRAQASLAGAASLAS